MDRVGLGGEYPSPSFVVTRFGSWRRALIAAGLEPGNPPPATKEAMVDALRFFNAAHGHSPTTSAWRAERQFPVSETIIRHCGSWRAALALAGLPPPDPTPRGPSDREILEAATRLPSRAGGATDNSRVERAASPARLQADPRPVRIVDRSACPCRNRSLIGEQSPAELHPGKRAVS